MRNVPENAVLLSQDLFEELAFRHRRPISLPSPEGGWATMRHGSLLYATWVGHARAA